MIHLQLNQVSVTRGKKEILAPLTATITDSCAIVGPSGSGKSTLAGAILGLIPHRGTIEHPSHHFALIPQDPATALHPLKKISTQFNELCSVEEQHSILVSLGFSDTKAILKSYPHQLSGGMKQRVLIGLALASKPDVLVADEPTTGLDILVQREIVKLLAKIQIPLLLITHDEKLARCLCPLQLRLTEGRLDYFGGFDAGV